MTPEKGNETTPDPVAYDLPRALAYLESLQRVPDRLAAEDFRDEATRS
jgi:hypothetical protein